MSAQNMLAIFSLLVATLIGEIKLSKATLEGEKEDTLYSQMGKPKGVLQNSNENLASWNVDKQEIDPESRCIGLAYKFYSICINKCGVFLKRNTDALSNDAEENVVFKSCKAKFCPSKAGDVYQSCLKNKFQH